MAIAFFQIPLSVQPQPGGEAVLVPPDVLQDLNYQFVLVKEGGEEAIIQLDTAETDVKKLDKDKHCTKLTEAKLKTLKASYPTPKLKQRYRVHLDAPEITSEPFEVDQQGDKVVETVQTVRSGFYLIDVPVVAET